VTDEADPTFVVDDILAQPEDIEIAELEPAGDQSEDLTDEAPALRGTTRGKRRAGSKSAGKQRSQRRSAARLKQDDPREVKALNRALARTNQELENLRETFTEQRARIAALEMKCEMLEKQKEEMKTREANNEAQNTRTEQVRSLALVGGGLGAGISPHIMLGQGLVPCISAIVMAAAVFLLRGKIHRVDQ
jgi:type I site-specific restriction endonuclease